MAFVVVAVLASLMLALAAPAEAKQTRHRRGRQDRGHRKADVIKALSAATTVSGVAVA